MCGIAGVWNTRHDTVADERLVRGMCALMKHRGPDDEGLVSSNGITLGMRRLSIIDLAGGQQPVTNEDGTVWAVFNGEIYNYQELRARLQAAGHALTSVSDSETIVHAYEEYGLDFPQHLNGMFAIGLWDAQRQRLVLVRDRFGKKPLFYASTDDGLTFASELKCLLYDPRLTRAVDPGSLDLYLTLGYVPTPRTILKGVHKVRPAHMLVFDRGEAHERRYWQLSPRDTVGVLSDRQRREAADELEQRLETAVRRRLISDVPLGAFLSAGLDSSVVVALMARLMDEPPRTFTIGVENTAMNEAPEAAQTARALGTRHHSLTVQPDLEHVLEPIVWGMDEPQADSSCVPTYYVSRLARQHVTVCLTGDGGDEVFAGYTRYVWADRERWFDTVPSPVRRVAGHLGTLAPAGMRGRGLLRRLPLAWHERYSRGMTTFDHLERSRLYDAAWYSQLADAPPAPHAALLANTAHADLISALQWTDVHSYLTDDILAKVDRMSMVNSLETRCPLLDHELVEFAFSLPISALYAGGVGKLLFRDVARRLVPPALLNRRKTGFSVPVTDWLRGPMRELTRSVLLSDNLARRGWFDRGRVARLIREHEQGRVDHGPRLWSLLILELWAERFLDAPVLEGTWASAAPV